MTLQNAQRSRGFTLIELMVVVAVVAIIAAIAVPSYRESVIKTRRGTAAACMLSMAQYAERYYTTKLTYTGLTQPTLQCATEMGTYYKIDLAPANATSYTVIATPKGAQLTGDTKCGTLTLNSNGTKSVSGTSSATPKDCF